MQQQTSSEALVPSAMRPVPLQTRADLVVQEISYRGVPFPVVKDPVGLKYYRLQPEQYCILKLLDGRRSLQDLRDDLQAEFPTTHVTPVDVQSLIIDLHEKGLLVSQRLGQGEALMKRRFENQLKQFRQTALNPLYIRLPGWDPDRVLTRLEPWLGWLFEPPAAVVAMLFVMTSWLFLAIRFDTVRQRLPEFQQFFGWPNLIYLWLTLAGAKILHEFGHGLSCKHFGSECHSMGVMLLVFSPTLYCDVTDSWMMKNKWHRIFIGAAGMYVEVILAACAIFVWYNTQPGMLNHLALNVFFVSTVTTVIFNANPLLRYDGYYMLADYLEIPNLRDKATKMLQRTFAWWAFGIETPEDPFMPTTGKHWFILFAVASSIYRWVVLLGITIFLYTVLKPYRLQNLGIILALSSVSAIFIGLFWSLFKLLSAPRQDPMSKLRVLIAIVLLAGAIAGALMIPVPWYEEAAFYIEPVGIQHVYTTSPGFLEEIRVAPGDAVKKGDRLVLLKSPELVDKRDQLDEERKAQAVDPRMYRELKDPESEHLAERRLQTLQHELADIDEQLRQLDVTAPVEGIVIAPPRVPRPTIEKTEQQLPPWHGTPLDPMNLGTVLQERTHVCSVAPSDVLQGVLLVGQGDRGDLQIGDQVRLKLDLFPDRILTGTISEFADRHLEFAPPALSNKYGGPLPTVTDPEGREKLTNPVYQGMVKFDGDFSELRTGMRGRARFIVAERTLWIWLWRWFRQTFHFRL